MDEVTIGGVTYLPATKLAKQYRYTTDYIGQLCRSKKIDAQLVGRSWYVNPLSLENHKSGRYSKTIKAKSEQPLEKSLEVTMTRVEPVMKKATIKSLERVGFDQAASRNFVKRIDWKPVKYELDESELLPPLRRDIKPVTLPINLAESADITIKSAVKSTKLVPEELPEVALKGAVKIVSLNEYFDTEVESDLDVDFPKIAEEKEPTAAKVVSVRPVLSKNTETQRREPVKRETRSYETVVATDDGSQIGWSLVSITTTVVAALFVAFGLLALEHEIRATANSYAAGLSFSVEDYQKIFDNF